MKTVAALIFEGMAPLDLFGPIQVFTAAYTPREDDSSRPDTNKPLYKVITVGRNKGPVATGANGTGLVVIAEHGINDDFDFDDEESRGRRCGSTPMWVYKNVSAFLLKRSCFFLICFWK